MLVEDPASITGEVDEPLCAWARHFDIIPPQRGGIDRPKDRKHADLGKLLDPLAKSAIRLAKAYDHVGEDPVLAEMADGTLQRHLDLLQGNSGTDLPKKIRVQTLHVVLDLVCSRHF